MTTRTELLDAIASARNAVKWRRRRWHQRHDAYERGRHDGLHEALRIVAALMREDD